MMKPEMRGFEMTFAKCESNPFFFAVVNEWSFLDVLARPTTSLSYFSRPRELARFSLILFLL